MRFDDDHVDDFGLGLTELERLLSRRRARRTYGDEADDAPNTYRRGNTFPRDDDDEQYDEEPRERYEPPRSRQPAKYIVPRFQLSLI